MIPDGWLWGECHSCFAWVWYNPNTAKHPIFCSDECRERYERREHVRQGGSVRQVTKETLLRKLRAWHACDEAVAWLKASDHATLQEAWNACERPDWML